MKNNYKSMYLLEAAAGVVIFIAALFMNENRAVFMLLGVVFVLMGLGMHAAERKKEIKR